MTKAQIIKYSLVGLFALGGLLLVLTFFKKDNTGIDYKDLIKAKDETIKAEKDKQAIYEDRIDDLKTFIDDHKRNDSILVTQITTNKQTLKQVDERIKNIPARINALADDNAALRRAIAEL